MPRQRPGYVTLSIEIHERLMAIIDGQFALSGEQSKACFISELLNSVTNARIPHDVLCPARGRPRKLAPDEPKPEPKKRGRPKKTK